MTETTRTAPSGNIFDTSEISEIGGIVIQLTGLNGNSVFAQIAASELPTFYTSTSGPNLITEFGGFDSIRAQLGGGFSEIAIRLTVDDGDHRTGFATNADELTINGVEIGNFSDVPTVTTNTLGTTESNPGNGFPDGQLATGWFHVTDSTILSDVYTALSSDIINLSINSSTSGNFLGFNEGVEQSTNGFITAGAVIMGTTGNDVLVGTAENEIIFGLEGNDQINAGDGFDTLNGDDGNDILMGEGGADRLNGGNGDDTLNGGADNDILDGGEGNDLLIGSDGEDELLGGNGDDTLNGGADNDILDGGEGNDTINGGAGADFILGRNGNDVIDGSGGDDNINAGNGDDIVIAGSGNDRVADGAGADSYDLGSGDDIFRIIDDIFGDDTTDGGVGFDTLDLSDFSGKGTGRVLVDLDGGTIRFGNSASDTVTGFEALIHTDDGGRIDGTADDNIITAAGGDDTVFAGAGHDTITGDAGNDRLFGEDGNDILSGGDGDDRLLGHDGDDVLTGDDGNDALIGGAGMDVLNGGDGDDRLVGQDGDDVLLGGAGNDRLVGGAGQDRFEGGTGDDVLVDDGPDTDIDTFVFDVGTGNDRILSYDQGSSILELDSALWGGGLTAAQVINQFGFVNAAGTKILLNFGDDSIELVNGDGLDLSILAADILII